MELSDEDLVLMEKARDKIISLQNDLQRSESTRVEVEIKSEKMLKTLQIIQESLLNDYLMLNDLINSFTPPGVPRNPPLVTRESIKPSTASNTKRPSEHVDHNQPPKINKTNSGNSKNARHDIQPKKNIPDEARVVKDTPSCNTDPWQSRVSQEISTMNVERSKPLTAPSQDLPSTSEISPLVLLLTKDRKADDGTGIEAQLPTQFDYAAMPNSREMHQFGESVIAKAGPSSQATRSSVSNAKLCGKINDWLVNVKKRSMDVHDYVGTALQRGYATHDNQQRSVSEEEQHSSDGDSDLFDRSYSIDSNDTVLDSSQYDTDQKDDVEEQTTKSVERQSTSSQQHQFKTPQSIPNTRKRINCTLCEASFENCFHLYHHIAEDHANDKRTIKCRFCYFVGVSVNEAVAHEKHIHNEQFRGMNLNKTP